MGRPPPRQLPPELASLIETVAALQEDMTVLKAALMDERWQKAAENFQVQNENVLKLHERVMGLESAIHQIRQREAERLPVPSG